MTTTHLFSDSLSSSIIASPFPILALSSCFLYSIPRWLGIILKGSSSVRNSLYVVYLVVQLFLDLGIYSGIFVIYLQCPSRESRTAKTVFYLLSLLYVLSMATFVADILAFIFKLIVSNNSIFYQLCRTCPYTFSSASKCQ